MQNIFAQFKIIPQQANQQKILNSEPINVFKDFKKNLSKINGADLNQKQMETLLQTTLEIQRIIQQNKFHQQIQKEQFQSILIGLGQKNIHIEINKQQKDISYLTQVNINQQKEIQELKTQVETLNNKLSAQQLSIDTLLNSFETNINESFENEQLTKQNEEFQTIIHNLTDKLAKCKGKIHFLKSLQESI